MTHFLLPMALLGIVLLALHIVPIRSIPMYDQCCASTPYRSSTHVCCSDGYTLRKYFEDVGWNPACCGSSRAVYDQETSLCCESTIIKKRSSADICCGKLPYDKTKEICCSGNRYSLTGKFSTAAACCGKDIYSTQSHLCCQGKILMKINSNVSNNECCGDEVMDTTTQKCCDGFTRPLSTYIPSDYMCCGSTVKGYNHSYSRCCFRRISDTQVYGQIYNHGSQQCCNGYVASYNYRYSQCCGTTSYDRYYYGCCGGKTQYRTSSESCCYVSNSKESVVISDSSEICCSGEVVNKTSSSETSCCNKVPYDPNRQKCCNGVINGISSYYSYSCCGTKAYRVDYDEYLCCNGVVNGINRYYSNRYSCCGTKAYRSDNELCCNGVVHSGSPSDYRCCGTQRYYYRSHQCCGTTVIDSSSYSSYGCCNGQRYTKRSQTCCSGNVVSVTAYSYTSSTSNFRCCGKHAAYEGYYGGCCVRKNKYTAYDRHYSACCDEELFTTTLYNSAGCCILVNGTTQIFDTRTQRCCQGILYDHLSSASSSYGCCGAELYRSSTHSCCSRQLEDGTWNRTIHLKATSICCSGVLRSNSDGKTSCCGNISYNYGNARCCGGVIRSNSDGKTSCCGNVSYNSGNSICCRGVVRSNSDGKTSCCGNVSYNSANSRCCSSTYSRVANSSQICCSGVVRSSSAGKTSCCGNVSYNSGNSRCCSSTYSRVYNYYYQVCCSGVVRSNSDGKTSCCGNVSYNSANSGCCSSTYSRVYNYYYQVCCSSNVFPKFGSSTQCCSRYASYDAGTSMCCSLSDGTKHVVPKISSYTSCCWNGTYQTDKEKCCYRKQSSKDPYYYAVVPKTTSDSYCCGNGEYQYNSQICCGSSFYRMKAYPKVSSSYSRCCGDGTYRTDKEKCCYRRQSNKDPYYYAVVPKTTSDSYCCGNGEYQSNSQLCCGSSFYGRKAYPKVSSSYSRCCGDGTYRTDTEICCGITEDTKRAYPKDGYTSCCGDRPYQTDTQICCGNRKSYPKESEKCTYCCGDVLMPCEQRHLCCENKIADLVTTQCCAGRMINLKSDICCNDRKFYRFFHLTQSEELTNSMSLPETDSFSSTHSVSSTVSENTSFSLSFTPTFSHNGTDTPTENLSFTCAVTGTNSVSLTKSLIVPPPPSTAFSKALQETLDTSTESTNAFMGTAMSSSAAGAAGQGMRAMMVVKAYSCAYSETEDPFWAEYPIYFELPRHREGGATLKDKYCGCSFANFFSFCVLPFVLWQFCSYLGDFFERRDLLPKTTLGLRAFQRITAEANLIGIAYFGPPTVLAFVLLFSHSTDPVHLSISAIGAATYCAIFIYFVIVLFVQFDKLTDVKTRTSDVVVANAVPGNFFVEKFYVFYYRTKNPWNKAYRSQVLEDISTALLLGILAGVRLKEKKFCIATSASMCAVSIFHFVFLVILRPFKEKFEFFPNVAVAFLQAVSSIFALALAIIGEEIDWVVKTLGYLAVIQAVVFYIQLFIMIGSVIRVSYIQYKEEGELPFTCCCGDGGSFSPKSKDDGTDGEPMLDSSFLDGNADPDVNADQPEDQTRTEIEMTEKPKGNGGALPRAASTSPDTNDPKLTPVNPLRALPSASRLSTDILDASTCSTSQIFRRKSQEDPDL